MRRGETARGEAHRRVVVTAAPADLLGAAPISLDAVAVQSQHYELDCGRAGMAPVEPGQGARMTVEGGRQARRATFPNLPDANWWALRRRFQQTMPREIDASYLATVLNIGEAAAGNLVGPLRSLGLIDEDGRPTDLALAWRDDEQYRQVTQTMLKSVYPQALIDAAPPPNPDRGAVVRWFSRATGGGQAITERMARLYLLLAAGDPAGAHAAADRQSSEQAPRGRPSGRSGAARRSTPARPAVTAAPQPAVSGPASTLRQAHQPSVHIDVQVHIDPAATAEQIDHIFASMARHLYDRE
jgi:uncharacterized protein DUF5343